MLKTYIFAVKIQEEEDKRWSVWIPDLQGCTSWGYSKQEALENIKEALQLYVEVMIEKGEPLPANTELKTLKLLDSPAVAIAI
ncbi:MAG: type II toxin-antitoxin system HicB family antitoxin [Candidatus Eremiobacteraeota bacterium]|nr:type II toxin-antitoxin system HicB family antitoxin [Candidatus Eremiobacteraeota bacterium]